MTNSELTRLVSVQLKLPRKDARAAVDAVFDSIISSLEVGRRVELRGFGIFGLRNRRARTGRNPKTGESVSVDARRKMFFKAGKEMKERVNRGLIALTDEGSMAE